MTVEDRNDHADLGHNVNRRVNRRLDRRLDEDLDRSTPAASPLQGRDALGQPAAGLRAWMAAAGEPEYRGAQLYHALYAQRLFDFASITNLPAALRTRLATELRIGIPQIARRYLSTDGSVRYLLSPPWPDISQEASREPGGVTDGSRAAIDAPLDQLISSAALSNGVASGVASGVAVSSHATGRTVARPVGARFEAVFMPSDGRQTICISTQAGCAVDCHFCLTAQLGLIRNLTPGEIVGQVLVALDDNRETLAPRTNVVMMGQGEPLLNFDPVMAAVRLMLDPDGMGLAARHVTLSTSGIIPGIIRLAREKVRPRLAVSLNASSDEQRETIMPINRKYPLRDLLGACRNYPLRTWERLTFEYVLLGGFNDTADDARRVARLIDGLHAKVNLIPWNPGELPYRAPESVRVEEFRRVLEQKSIPAFVRYSRGRDIAAACGQLALLETTA